MSDVDINEGNGGTLDPDLLEREAFVAERLKEFEDEKEEEPEEDEAEPIPSGHPVSKTPLDSETTKKSSISKVEPSGSEKLDGKRWSDGGYGYGFDCSNRMLGSTGEQDSGIITLPLATKDSEKKEKLENDSAGSKSRSSFDLLRNALCFHILKISDPQPSLGMKVDQLPLVRLEDLQCQL